MVNPRDIAGNAEKEEEEGEEEEKDEDLFVGCLINVPATC